MGTYLLIYTFLSTAIVYLNTRRVGKRANKFTFIFFSVWMIAISVFRYRVGYDWDIYEWIFQSISNTNSLQIAIQVSPVEIGYTILNYIVSRFTNNFVWVSGICALVTLTFFCVSIYKYSQFPLVSLYFFVSLGFFYISMNFIRQMLACSIVLMGYSFLRKRQIIKFVLIVLFAATFHTAVIAMLILIPFRYIKTNIKFVVSSLLLTLAFMVIFPKLLSIFVEIFPKYSIYLNRMEFGRGGNFKSTVIWFSIALVSLCMRFWLDLKGKNMDILILGMYTAFLVSLMQNSISIFSRVVPYFSIFSILLLPQIPKIFANKKQQNLVFLCLITCGLLSNIYKLYFGENGVVPYNMCF